MNKELHEFVSSIENKDKQNDTQLLIKLMTEASGFTPSLHNKIIGYGLYGFKYKTGKEGLRIITGFSPRKQNFTIYIMNGFSRYKKDLEKLGKYKISNKCCLYIKKLADIDEKVLKTIIKKSVADMSKKYEFKST